MVANNIQQHARIRGYNSDNILIYYQRSCLVGAKKHKGYAWYIKAFVNGVNSYHHNLLDIIGEGVMSWGASTGMMQWLQGVKEQEAKMDQAFGAQRFYLEATKATGLAPKGLLEWWDTIFTEQRFVMTDDSRYAFGQFVSTTKRSYFATENLTAYTVDRMDEIIMNPDRALTVSMLQAVNYSVVLGMAPTQLDEDERMVNYPHKIGNLTRLCEAIIHPSKWVGAIQESATQEHASFNASSHTDLMRYTTAFLKCCDLAARFICILQGNWIRDARNKEIDPLEILFKMILNSDVDFEFEINWFPNSPMSVLSPHFLRSLHETIGSLGSISYRAERARLMFMHGLKAFCSKPSTVTLRQCLSRFFGCLGMNAVITGPEDKKEWIDYKDHDSIASVVVSNGNRAFRRMLTAAAIKTSYAEVALEVGQTWLAAALPGADEVDIIRGSKDIRECLKRKYRQ